jgi:hypothetical protein
MCFWAIEKLSGNPQSQTEIAVSKEDDNHRDADQSSRVNEGECAGAQFDPTQR